MPAWEENAEQISQIEAFTYSGRGARLRLELPLIFTENKYNLTINTNILPEGK